MSLPFFGFMAFYEAMIEEIHLAATQGFCAGVASAILVVEKALERYKAPLYVRHHIVHNSRVIQNFERQGVVFIENLDEVPAYQTVVFSAHGTAPEEYQKAKKRGLHIIDATCPLVSKIHREAVRLSQRQVTTILIGHKGHQEMLGTSGYIPPHLLHIVETEEDIQALPIHPDTPVSYLTQTTLSISDTKHLVKKIKEKFPHIVQTSKSNICFATQNRQNAALALTQFCEVMIVCGSHESSNTNRLKELCKTYLPTYMIDDANELEMAWLKGVKKVGITSGASVPSEIIQEVVSKLKKAYPRAKVFQEENIEKDIEFPLPSI